MGLGWPEQVNDNESGNETTRLQKKDRILNTERINNKQECIKIEIL